MARATWYNLEDGNTVDPNDCAPDEKGVLRHNSGVAVAMRGQVPWSRGVDLDNPPAAVEAAKAGKPGRPGKDRAAEAEQAEGVDHGGEETSGGDVETVAEPKKGRELEPETKPRPRKRGGYRTRENKTKD